MLATLATAATAQTRLDEWQSSRILDRRSDTECPRIEYRETRITLGGFHEMGYLLGGGVTETVVIIPTRATGRCSEPRQFMVGWDLGGMARGASLDLTATFGECRMGDCGGGLADLRKFQIAQFDRAATVLSASETGVAAPLQFYSEALRARDRRAAEAALEQFTRQFNAGDLSGLYGAFDSSARSQLSRAAFDELVRSTQARLGGGIRSRSARGAPYVAHEADGAALLAFAGLVGKNEKQATEVVWLVNSSAGWKVRAWNIDIAASGEH